MIKRTPLPKNIEALLPKAQAYLRSRSDIVFASLAKGKPKPLSDVDIAGHIISDQKYRVPNGYADTFKVLHEEGIFDKYLFQTMEKMAKFRNIVVHD